MSEHGSIPKGMKNLPDEYAPPNNVDFSGSTMNHSVINYSSMVREAIKKLEKDGYSFDIRRLEVLEQESGPAVISLAIEVYER